MDKGQLKDPQTITYQANSVESTLNLIQWSSGQVPLDVTLVKSFDATIVIIHSFVSNTKISIGGVVK